MPQDVFIKGGFKVLGNANRSGFALITTLTLVAFLLLLMLALSTVTVLETKMASNTQQSAEARQNALIALQIAVSQLQIYTGPDQRTTARADMNTAWANTSSANGHWLGAYGNGAVIDTDYTAKPSTIPATIISASNPKGSQASLLNWLVSGNENTGFNPASDVATDGHILNPPTSFDYTPATSVDLSTATATPGLTDTQTLLVGDHSSASQNDRVTAPLVPIHNDIGNATVGRYAWWIGDEGAKARINLPQPSTTQISAAFVTAQRTAVEWVDKTNANGSSAPFSSNDLIGSNYDPSLSEITMVSTPQELPLISSAAPGTMSTTARLRYHDLTGNSRSVLVDSYAGGLKKDLSAVLATGASSPADTDFIFPPDGNNNFGVPTWGLLRSFAQTTAPSSGLDPRLPTITQTGISPILTYASLGMRYIAPNGDAEGQPIRLALFPLAVLWNPYTFTIRASQYELGFTKKGSSPIQLQVAKVGTTSPWTVKETLDFNRGLAALTGGVVNADGSADVSSTQMGTYESGTPSADSYVRFVIDSPEIPPGASLIFTLQGSESGQDYDSPFNDAPQNVLTNGLNSSGHVLVNKGTIVGPGESGKNFRVGINYNPDFIGERTIFSPAPAQYASMSGGEASVYLGQVSSSPPSGYSTSDANDKRWYQSITRTSPAQDSSSGGNILHGRNALLQSTAPLSKFDAPVSALSFQKVFSAQDTIRWVAQSNPRAPMVTRTRNNQIVLNQIAGLGMDTPWMNFYADSSGLRASAGPSLDSSTSIVDATLFEFRPDDQALLSLGQLQHANLSLMHAYPAYPIGNSIGDFHFKNNREQVWLDQTGLTNGINAPTTVINSYYDLSWLLNRVLWDQYFVSSVPHSGTGTSTDSNSSPIPTPLPNPRMTRYGDPTDADLRDADKAAANLMLEGGFNINSTSEQAWRAVLAGINQVAYDPVNGTPSSSLLEASLSRFSKPTAQPSVGTDQAWAWQGFRQLTDEQIATLASNIVTEIRNRGPFVSLADFVNRRLVDNTATTNKLANEQFKGALQAAIDATYSGSAATNSSDSTAYGAVGTNPFDSVTTPTYSAGTDKTDLFDMELIQGYEGATDSSIASGAISAYSPQFLTQADVLSAIGPSLVARSDTFIIRTYGDVTNPLTQEVESRAWCEAIVQRMPDYIEATINPEDTPTAGSLSQRLGRRYEILSLRWLSADEI